MSFKIRMPLALVLLLAACTAAEPTRVADDAEDPFLWLEEVDGEKPLSWAKEVSAATTARLEAVPQFGPIHERFVEIYNSEERIPSPTLLRHE